MKSMKRSTIGLVAALLLAAIGGFLLLSSGSDDNSQAANEEVATTDVLFANRNIPSRTTAADMAADPASWVEVRSVAVDDVQAGALTDTAALERLALEGNIVLANVSAGQQLTLSDFFEPGGQDTGAVEDDPTLFQMTVALESQRALGGNIFAGQEVAVVASFDAVENFPGGTRVVLDAVEITNVETETLLTQEQITNDPLAPTLATTGRIFVTFGVSVEDLEKLTFANEFGRIWLARQGEEATADDSELRTVDTVMLFDFEAPANAEG